MYFVARSASPALMPANTVKTFSTSVFGIDDSPSSSLAAQDGHGLCGGGAVGGQVAGQQGCRQQDQDHRRKGGEIKPANAEEHTLHGALHEVCAGQAQS